MKKIITLSSLALVGVIGHAQMKDITLTLQPTVAYHWFDNNTAIEDGVMYGARVGFGFGEAIELRAIYEKSADLKNSVDGLNIFSDNFVDNFNSRSVDIERIGGEFKANIPTRGTFVPYVNFGAGVQKLAVDIAAQGAPANVLKSDQIYGQLGLGTKIRLGTRLFLNLEAKNTVFNMNPNSVLFQEGQDQSEIEDWLGDDTNTRMYNWSVLAGLQLYLGGRIPEESSPLDIAYRNKFSGGQSGFKLIVEPVGAYVNFDNDTNFRDAYFLGGKAGFDFNQYVGLRAYYYQATRNEQISTDFDDIAMYGGDFIAKLNVSRGVTPYINLGGGYLNVYNTTYLGKDGLTGASSGYFAKGGLGLNIPLSRNLEIFGDASLMYTSERNSNDLQNTVSPDELRTHTMYTAGLRFQLGKKADDTDRLLQNDIDDQVAVDTEAYRKRINELELELSKAYKNNDTKKAVEIIEEKKDLDRKILDKSEYKHTEYAIKNNEKTSKVKEQSSESRIQMTPKELEEMIDKVIQGVNEESLKPQTINDRMDRLERLLLEVNTGVYRENLSPARQEDTSQKILNKLIELDRKIESNTNQINNLIGNVKNPDQPANMAFGQQPATVTPVTVQENETKIATDEDDDTAIKIKNAVTVDKNTTVSNERFSVFTGFAVADDVALILGFRGNYDISETRFKFMPDFYLAPGKNTGFGINANVIVPFTMSEGVFLNPYAGLGVGYNDVAGVSAFSPNLIVGTSFNLLNGRLFADYTAHNFVDIHRISIGYKLSF